MGELLPMPIPPHLPCILFPRFPCPHTVVPMKAATPQPIGVVVNGALLTVPAGAALSLGPGPAHVLCIAAGGGGGCVVHTCSAIALRPGEAATVAVGHDGAMVIDALPPQPTTQQRPHHHPHHHPQHPPRKRSHCLRPGSRPAPARAASLPAGVDHVSRIANNHAVRWRVCATSFSTMARFLQRFNRDLRWHRPDETQQTVVHWGPSAAPAASAGTLVVV